MAITTHKFVRKPLYVEAVRVSPENFLEIAFWCHGSIKNNDGTDTKPGAQIDPSSQHIQVRVHNPKNARQTKAMIGDWILYTERGYKVYTERAFKSSFDKVPDNQLQLEPNKEAHMGDQQDQQQETQVEETRTEETRTETPVEPQSTEVSPGEPHTPTPEEPVQPGPSHGEASNQGQQAAEQDES